MVDGNESDLGVTQFGSLIESKPSETPDVLDVLIAGGGPAGTTAALRARELGLNVLVVDYDDLMKRIRDYPKEKQILPSYGGGDKTPFPTGGERLPDLHFDPIDKDDLVHKWKQCYATHSIPARIGSELTGLERREDGHWTVLTWNHRKGEEIRYAARFVVIAIGAGVPRRFDIPGDTDGIAFRLDDAATFVGGPALVIGGGTSAAEAVIAISKAKVAAEDESDVYWSYRGASLPKVSKALGEVFFEAYIGNGNVRYLRHSDPTSVVVGPDRQGYLSLRVDRREMTGRPAETVHMEFLKSQVLACIGEDLPVKLLERLGLLVPRLNDQPRMLVDGCGQTSLPNVFLAGDARGPRFLRCGDFNDSESYEKISIKRNIKAAMTDAVAVMNEIGRRCGQEIADEPVVVVKAAEPKPFAVAKSAAPVAAAAPKAPLSEHPEEVLPGEHRSLIVALRADGEAEEEFPLRGAAIGIGREGPDIAFSGDVHMAPRHATLHRSTDPSGAESFQLECDPESSGAWLRVQGPDGTALGAGAQLWIGGQLLAVAGEAGAWKVLHYDPAGQLRGEYPVPEAGCFVGRSSEIALDPEDLSISRRHAQLVPDGTALRAYDRGAANGTWLRATNPTALHNGDEFRLATHTLRLVSEAASQPIGHHETIVVRLQPAESEPTPDAAPASSATSAAANPATAAPAANANGPGVLLRSDDAPVEFAVASGQTILEGYLAAGHSQDEPLGFECKKGICGYCCVQILEGAEHFEGVDPGSSELKTIQTAAGVEPDPTRYRLGCLAKIRGRVVLGIPE